MVFGQYILLRYHRDDTGNDLTKIFLFENYNFIFRITFDWLEMQSCPSLPQPLRKNPLGKRV